MYLHLFSVLIFSDPNKFYFLQASNSSRFLFTFIPPSVTIVLNVVLCNLACPLLHPSCIPLWFVQHFSLIHLFFLNPALLSSSFLLCYFIHSFRVILSFPTILFSKFPPFFLAHLPLWRALEVLSRTQMLICFFFSFVFGEKQVQPPMPVNYCGGVAVSAWRTLSAAFLTRHLDTHHYVQKKARR